MAEQGEEIHLCDRANLQSWWTKTQRNNYENWQAGRSHWSYASAPSGSAHQPIVARYLTRCPDASIREIFGTDVLDSVGRFRKCGHVGRWFGRNGGLGPHMRLVGFPDGDN
jgi:hypothetical protein